MFRPNSPSNSNNNHRFNNKMPRLCQTLLQRHLSKGDFK
jgi:hypothetical protein